VVVFKADLQRFVKDRFLLIPRREKRSQEGGIILVVGGALAAWTPME